jgi:4-hydroxybenzoate polyprenyltransferase
VAATGELAWTPFVVALGVLLWVAGFDTFYALQDVAFDREHGLRSIPARFGIRGAFRAARLFHAGAVLVLLLPYWILDLSWAYLAGMAGIAVVLLYEHRLVSPEDLTRLDRAFFDMNAAISLAYLAAALLGVL